jgi:5-methyltetrahydrofolate--homocysteine methyltransferase
MLTYASGKYPNRGYPRIFDDETVGAEAKTVFEDAQKMLKSICDGRKLQANAVVAFYAANSMGDDIEIYEDDNRTVVSQTLHTLRQQEAREEQTQYLAMSDFIAPKGSGVKDYIGLFAATAGIGMDKLIQSYEEKNDDYGKIMAQALGDRLAEVLCSPFPCVASAHVHMLPPSGTLRSTAGRRMRRSFT